MTEGFPLIDANALTMCHEMCEEVEGDNSCLALGQQCEMFMTLRRKRREVRISEHFVERVRSLPFIDEPLWPVTTSTEPITARGDG